MRSSPVRLRGARGAMVLVLIVVAVAGGIAAPAVAATARAAQQDPLVVMTDKGAVRGFQEASGVDAFLGIRYAAAPVGALRWRPPQPAAAWSDVFDASHFRNTC